MAKDKERAINPAAAQRKLEKQKALKKGKATVAAQRTERLARRNPERLQQQIDSLKAAASSGRPLAARDTKLLADLERDVARVRKARETLGAPQRAATHHTRGPGRGAATAGVSPASGGATAAAAAAARRTTAR
ncbi:MAG: hypothetical protein FRX48_02240 [Lasallia pustulata]|uniref:Wbp11/ELF5/Saf1 N-terminal domain-containing protein n=1 Tax=Lasallia pustulata TaxID=136370 RepID=A0A5M8PYS6_9LECA|nr:MAG: hypothetical protein FRX48_02240 [Lasallia pustulata]